MIIYLVNIIRSFLLLAWGVLLGLEPCADFGVEVGQVLEVCLILVFVFFQIELFVGEGRVLAEAVDQLSGLESVGLVAAEDDVF